MKCSRASWPLFTPLAKSELPRFQAVGGGLAAGATALGTGAVAIGGDIVGGVMGAASGVGHLASRLFHW